MVLSLSEGSVRVRAVWAWVLKRTMCLSDPDRSVGVAGAVTFYRIVCYGLDYTQLSQHTAIPNKKHDNITVGLSTDSQSKRVVEVRVTVRPRPCLCPL